MFGATAVPASMAPGLGVKAWAIWVEASTTATPESTGANCNLPSTPRSGLTVDIDRLQYGARGATERDHHYLVKRPRSGR